MRIFKLTEGCSHVSRETGSLPLGCVFALGCFDGVHIGHSALIKLAADTARSIGAVPAVWCIRGGKPFTLSDEEDQLRYFAAAGADYAVFEDFSAVRDMSAKQFAGDYLKNTLTAAGAVCGFNFRFAAGRAADANTLMKLCSEFDMAGRIAPAVTMPDGEAVSSSRIRAAVEEGNVALAAAMLGRPYSFEAPVIGGKHLGTRIGIPTVNQRIPEGMTIPKKGVYMSICTVGERRLRAITNIGVRPTVETADDILCESNILDETRNLYGLTLRLELMEYRREEKKFSSVEELRDTIRRDIQARYDYPDFL